MEAGIQDALQTWDCKTPDCEGTAYKRTGPYAMLCRLCTDEAREKARARQNGTAPNPEPVPAKALPLSFEVRATSLLELGRQLDEATAYRPARQAVEHAARRWREAVAQLPGAAVNGEVDEAAANRLLTHGLAQAVTDDVPDGP